MFTFRVLRKAVIEKQNRTVADEKMMIVQRIKVIDGWIDQLINGWMN